MREIKPYGKASGQLKLVLPEAGEAGATWHTKHRQASLVVLLSRTLMQATPASYTNHNKTHSRTDPLGAFQHSTHSSDHLGDCTRIRDTFCGKVRGCMWIAVDMG